MAERCVALEEYTSTHSAEDMRKSLKHLINKYSLKMGSATIVGTEEHE